MTAKPNLSQSNSPSKNNILTATHNTASTTTTTTTTTTQLEILNDLQQSGTYTQIQNDTRTLLYESGWYDKMKQLAIQSIQERGGGVTQVTVDDLVMVLLEEEKGKKMDCGEVPSHVKDFIQSKVLEFVKKKENEAA